jgi:uncharacterized membrane protein YeaQ/YmgE (transglycosylase-associated protein family)
MLNFVAWIVAGGVLGYIAARLESSATAPATLLNVLAGVVGGFLSGLLVKSVLLALDLPTAHFSLQSLAAAISGAGLLLVALNVPVRSRLR